MKWIAKAVVQKAISFMPNSQKLNYFFQKNVTKGVFLTDEYLHDKLVHVHDHLFYFRKYSNKPLDFTAVELGTGWYPVVPVCFFLAGAEKVITIDISYLLQREHVQLLLKKILEYYRDGKLLDFVPGLIPERINVLEKIFDDDSLSAEDLLSLMKISYEVQDARNLSLADSCADFITSNNTFEHIYPNILKEIIEEFKRIAKPGSVMSHFIDMSDHFAHIDKSINIYNFLKFSEKQWKLIDNDVQPQNRWRISQYRDLYKEVGVPISEEVNRPGNRDALSKINLATPFKEIDIADVAVSHSLLISKM
jgi:hypothetical protein